MFAASKKKEEVCGGQTLYRELGYYILRKDLYGRSLRFFDEAIRLNPTDKRALIGRCTARSKAVMYQGALEDIEKAVELDPNCLATTAQKALCTYYMGNFEDALIQNMKGAPLRRAPDYFQQGIMHCTEAIENGIGPRAGHPLRDHYFIIRKLAWKKALEMREPYKPRPQLKGVKKRKSKPKKKSLPMAVEPQRSLKSVRSSKSLRSERSEMSYGDDKSDKYISKDLLETNPSEALSIAGSIVLSGGNENKEQHPYSPVQRRTTNIENLMSEKYMERLCLDKRFLKELKDHPGVGSPNKAGTKKVKQLAREGYNALCLKEEVMRARRPFYYIKYNEVKLTENVRKREEAELKKIQEGIKNDVETFIKHLEEAKAAGKTKLCFDIADRAKTFIDKTAKKFLPKKDAYLENIYDLVAYTHMDTKKIRKNMGDYDAIRRIQFLLGLPMSREPSTDSIVKELRETVVDCKTALAHAEARLKSASTPLEIVWLYHEIARYNFDLKKFDLTKLYARKAIQEARRIDHTVWLINAIFLMVKVHFQQRNRNDAKTELYEALDAARSLRIEPLFDFIKKCIDVADRIDFDDLRGLQVIQKREKKIVQMLGDQPGMKEEVAFLFKKMSALPANRRMSIMPGVKLESEGIDKQAFARKQSIMTENMKKQVMEDVEKKMADGDEDTSFLALDKILAPLANSASKAAQPQAGA